MVVMEQTFELAIGGSQTTLYVVEQQLDDGRVVLRPQTEVERMHQEHGTRSLTQQEFDELIAPHVLPPDGEG
jgi:hypothetical protein